MPLWPCPDCGTEVSTSAVNCPQCGRPLNWQAEPTERKKGRSVASTLQIAGAILALMAAPLFTINPIWCLVAATPGLALFVAGRIMAD